MRDVPQPSSRGIIPEDTTEQIANLTLANIECVDGRGLHLSSKKVKATEKEDVRPLQIDRRKIGNGIVETDETLIESGSLNHEQHCKESAFQQDRGAHMAA